MTVQRSRMTGDGRRHCEPTAAASPASTTLPRSCRAMSVSLPLRRTADLSNVIPFARPRRGGKSSAPPVDARRPIGRRRRVAGAPGRGCGPCCSLCSLACMAALFFAFWREPEPLASIGVEVISVEIVLGATGRRAPRRPSARTRSTSNNRSTRSKPDRASAVEQERVDRAREVQPAGDANRRCQGAAGRAAQERRKRRGGAAAQRSRSSSRSIAMVETPQARNCRPVLPRETACPTREAKPVAPPARAAQSRCRPAEAVKEQAGQGAPE